DEASPTGGWYYMREWRVYSSEDMVNWTDHGPKLRPTGPFFVASEKPLITSAMSVSKGGFSEIDPTVFVDDDGQAYLYWGNGTCKYVKLNEDMISISGDIHEVKLAKYGEAPWLQKIDNTYYLSYSSNSPSTIEYATGPSATGPWEYKNRILEIVEVF
ncbi:MAG: family 43 glycosylhydrolase, partial [Bacteroidales bacterium]|nr:family 43 glycosylhydrolase [Bacteroidales bacterium]